MIALYLEVLAQRNNVLGGLSLPGEQVCDPLGFKRTFLRDSVSKKIYVCSTDTHLMMKGIKGASPRGEVDPSMGEG